MGADGEWKDYGDQEWKDDKDWKKDDYYSKKKDYNKKQYADKGDWKDWDNKDEKYPKSGTGTVIEVPDGATLVLNLAGFVPNTTSGKDLMVRKMGIAGCVAPRVCSKSGTDRDGNEQKDQHYAWESREYLRNWLLGKKVQYRLMYSKGEGSRWMEYCEVRYENTDVASQLVYECTVKFVNTDETRKGYGQAKAEDLEATGIALNELNYGVYDRKARNDETNIRYGVQYLQPGDSDGKLEAFMEENAGQYRDCIIEGVPDAGTYRLCILPREGYKWDTHTYVTVSLSGLVAPGFIKDEYFKEKEASKGSSLKARDWVIQRIMNKNMQVRLEKVEKVPMPEESGGLKGKGKGKGKKTDLLKNKHAPQEINPQFFKQEKVFASLKHPTKGTIADFLLEEGFGVFLKHTAAYSESGLQSLSDAEAKAKEDKTGRWKNYDPEEDERKRKKIEDEIAAEFFEFRGQVVEVVAGDQFKIIDIEERKEKRYYLANCQTKLSNQPGYGSIKGESTDPKEVKADDWSYATNEFLRKKLVGRTVTVKLEYKRHISYYLKQLKRKKWDDEEEKDDKAGGAQAFTLDELTGKKAEKKEKVEEKREAVPLASDENSGELYFVTLLDEKKNNVAIKAIEEGLLHVEKQRDEYYRSRHYDELQAAYKSAWGEQKGKFNEAAPAPEAPRYTELVLQPASTVGQAGRPRGPQTKKELSELATAYENQLKGKEHSGIITYVLSGSRYRLKLPYEKLLVNFQLSGVRAPNPPRGGAGGKGAGKGEGKGEGSFRGEPFGSDALQLAREQILQQDVKVLIDRVDPSGTFMGTLFTTSKDGRTKKNDLSKELLSRGFAWTDEYCYSNEYKVVETAAKEQKLGAWSVERKEPKKQKEEHDELAIGEMFQGSISYVTAVDDFYVIPDQDEAEEVQNKINEIEEYCKLVEKPRKSEIYIVQDYEDKKWYRATYEGHGVEGFTMKFVDTGAIAEVENDAVKQIPKGHELISTPYAAVNCQLYGVKAVEDTWEQAGEALFKLTNKQDIMGVVEYRTGGRARDGPGSLKMKVTLMMGKKLVQEELLKEGVVRLKLRENQPGGGRVDIKTWKDAQEKAKRARVNMWRMGDPGDSEDERY